MNPPADGHRCRRAERGARHECDGVGAAHGQRPEPHLLCLVFHYRRIHDRRAHFLDLRHGLALVVQRAHGDAHIAALAERAGKFHRITGVAVAAAFGVELERLS